MTDPNLTDEAERTARTDTARQVATAGIVSGVLCALGGLAAIVWPGVSLLVVGIAIGFSLLCAGILELFTAATEGSSALAAVLGVFAILIGVVVIRRPDQTLMVLVIAIGVWLVVSGILAGVVAFAGAPPSRGLALLSAAVDLALGLAILAWPKESLKTLAILAGIAFLLRGLLMVAAGSVLHRATRAAS